MKKIIKDDLSKIINKVLIIKESLFLKWKNMVLLYEEWKENRIISFKGRDEELFQKK